MKHIGIVFKIHIPFMLGRNLQTVSFSMLGHFTVRVIACLGVIPHGSVVINRMCSYIVYRLWWKVL